MFLPKLCGGFAAFACLLFAAMPAHAEQNYRINEQLSQSRSLLDSAHRWELTYLALSAVDAAQTINCLNKSTCEEANPLFGKRPSTKTILLTKAGIGLAHYSLFQYLNHQDPKLALRTAQISAGLQAGVVMLNFRVGF